MRKQTAKKFLEDNREALENLGDKLIELNKVTNCKDELDLRARKLAIETVNNWLGDLFSITKDDIMRVDEEENIYKRLNTQE